MGFNNEPVTSLVTPTISSVEMYAFETGKAAAKLFIEMMQGDSVTTHQEIVFKPTLFIRESTRRVITKKQTRTN